MRDEDAFLFLIVGNINLRLNTIFFLLENGITDGVLPLQRTVFEMQIAFKAYSNSEKKEDFLQAYFSKKGFESSIKWEKVLNSDDSNLFSKEEREKLADFKNDYEKSIKERFTMSPYKIWYEIASDKSLKVLSDTFYNGIEYFSNYDELSNWVHPQRLEENLNATNLTQRLPDEYLNLLIGSLMWDIKNLVDDVAFIANHYKVSQSQPLFNYGKNIEEFSKKLGELAK
ncbi:DUF5677 domain-containing protein [Enterococcus sp. BWT-B8]|uniref:DUF5677 domain-containing protein n=1 Tax=Enterococcus sp. BWT-B8 TaxID=2885157 RepID=UPI001E4BC8D5|nr:DUF5677 domain-containing protein [Enterococcus sp. BWT-B8]MCB5953343.1 DUF5677 domain-containing protein [Enterococcus sp. BWT-B8]